ncbi:uncharacterized protein LOC105926799 isoform X1 [Fundulus heteroclitus]|uniref:uncharacterized protein LOC105926799 isoform X1 n=1 Tax=Fundulus heteroclitus TaxID=8078 RepID=UPI00165BEC84|nr:uncharacterized protein LOC105926799 isoform X1 [Fundulus heteroclitus]
MPRKGRRSEAAKARWRRFESEPDIAKPRTPPPIPQSPTQSPEKKMPRLLEFVPPDQTCAMVCQEEPRGPSTPLGSRRGTGHRHRVMQWGYSRVTRRRRKFVLLAEAPEKKFALLVGDSHLRAIVDGFVTMPGSTFSLGVLSSPGASADELRREVLDAVLPRTPDVICLLAPSNNLSSSRTFQEAGRDFDSLLRTVSNLCANVVVLDFPPRLVVEESEQALLRQEYSCVAIKRSVRYLPVTEHFPLSHLDLWSKDGVHLSDTPGMEVLAELLWAAICSQLEFSAPVSASLPLSAFPPASASRYTVSAPPSSVSASRPLPASPPVSAERPLPRLVVDGKVPARSASDPFPCQKTLHNVQGGDGSPRSTLRTVDQEGDLLDLSIPLNQVWYSPKVLKDMDLILTPLPTSSPRRKKKASARRCSVPNPSKKRPQEQV